MNSRSLHKLLLISIAAFPLTDIKADSTPEPALVINEIMPANIDMFMDPSYNYGSWIELFNGTDQDINLAGYYLSDNASNPTLCPLGNTSRIVKSGGFLTLWFGHKDDYCPQQIEYSLDSDGGDIILSDSKGQAVSEVTYPASLARISWARTSDGGSEWGYTGNPTPGKSNIDSQFASDQIPAPEVSVESKLFTGSFSFTVNIPEGATLYYTENGSLPISSNRAAKTTEGSFNVSETKVYRFRLYKEGYLPSPVTTRSYINTPNKYGVPIVSIVTDNNGLYSSDYGMWAKGPHGKSGNGQNDLCNWNRDWDRSVNMEIFDTKGNLILSQEAEITPSGRYSRAYDPHPFKIKAKKKFGYENYFAFTPFSDKPYNKYQSLKFRSGGNNYTTRLKDAALQEIILRSGLNVDCQSYQPVHHYVNGVYKGITNIREPNNKDYAYSNYGYDEDEVDCFKLDHNNGNGGFTLTEGNRDAWDEWVRLSATASQDASYERICEIVDIDEFANYMAIEFYLANEDWPRNNIKSFRLSEGGRFRFVVFDLDHAFGAINQATGINPFTSFDDQEYYPEGGYKSAMVTIFHNMLKNKSFRKKFIDSYCIVAGSVFNTDRIKSIVNELANRAEREMAFKNESPKNDANLILNTITVDYRSNRINQLAGWRYAELGSATKAQKIIKSNNDNALLTLNGVEIPKNLFIGHLFLPATVKAIAPSGYKFIGWQKNNKIVTTDAEYTMTRTYEILLACFEPDSIVERPVRINEVSASNNVFINESFKKNDWIELYNTTSSSYDASGMFLSDKLSQPEKYVIPDGSVIPANGYLIIWCDKESGTQLHAPFKLDNKDENVILLTARDHSWADTLTYKKHTGYQSVGLYPDGGNTSYVMNRPSIGKTNNLSSYDNIDKQQVNFVRSYYYNEKNDMIYDLLGQPVPTPQPGQLYIRNGRKFFYRP
jgi:hypothetical protein